MRSPFQVFLVAKGQVRVPAGPWLEDAELYLCLQRSCLAVSDEETARWVMVQRLRVAGLAWRWENEDLVIELPR